METTNFMFQTLVSVFATVLLSYVFLTWIIRPSSESSEFSDDKRKLHAQANQEFVTLAELSESLRRGDLVECKRADLNGFGYDHWMVYVGSNEVIHLTTHGIKSTDIKKDKIQDAVKGSKCRVNDSLQAGLKRDLDPRSLEATAATAERLFQEFQSGTLGKKYNLLEFNCEHFATLCAFDTETPFSLQAELLANKPALTKMASSIVGSSS